MKKKQKRPRELPALGLYYFYDGNAWWIAFKGIEPNFATIAYFPREYDALNKVKKLHKRFGEIIAYIEHRQTQKGAKP